MTPLSPPTVEVSLVTPGVVLVEIAGSPTPEELRVALRQMTLMVGTWPQYCVVLDIQSAQRPSPTGRKALRDALEAAGDHLLKAYVVLDHKEQHRAMANLLFQGYESEYGHNTEQAIEAATKTFEGEQQRSD